VGFGDSFCEPLRLDEHGLQQDPRGAFRIEHEGLHHILRQRQDDGTWERTYCFTLQPRELQDFAAMCRFHQTSSQSGFTRRRIATRATPQGRITLSDTQFIITEQGTRIERPVNDEPEYRLLLRQFFGLELPPS
jgi:N-hydroxyarylamine O-acetyltransferase